MNKKSSWIRFASIFLLVALSLLSACSDAEENTSKNKIEAAPAVKDQTVITNKIKETEAKETKLVLQDVIGLYKELDTPQATKIDNKIEIIEVFWYGCSHCYNFEPYLDKWLEEKAEYIEFIRIPGILNKNWLPHARAFYVAKKLDILEKIHRPLFDAIHKDKRAILDEKSLKTFFSEHGVSGNTFQQAYQSKEVEENIKKAFKKGRDYVLTGVPTIIINGKYTTSASIAGSFEKIIVVINTLAAKEYKELSD